MSNFIVVFVASIIIIGGFYSIIANILGFIGVTSLLFALLITAVVKLYTKTEELEKRIDELEKTKED